MSPSKHYRMLCVLGSYMIVSNNGVAMAASPRLHFEATHTITVVRLNVLLFLSFTHIYSQLFV
jgi:hypothetical protein